MSEVFETLRQGLLSAGRREAIASVRRTKLKGVVEFTALGQGRRQGMEARLLSSPCVIRVPFFLLFGFDKGTLKQKGQKGTKSGTTQEHSKP